MFNTIRRRPDDSGTPHVPEQPKAPADSLDRGCVTSSTGSSTPNGSPAIPLSPMRCLGHDLARGAQILPGDSSHGWSAPEGGRGACSASASGSHLGRRSGARSGRNPLIRQRRSPSLPLRNGRTTVHQPRPICRNRIRLQARALPPPHQRGSQRSPIRGAQGFRIGRNAEGLGAARRGSRETPPFRPIRQRRQRPATRSQFLAKHQRCPDVGRRVPVGESDRAPVLSAAIVRSPLGIARCRTARALEAIVKTSASRRGLWTGLSAAGAGASRLIARAGAISRSRPEGQTAAPSVWLALSTRSRDPGVHSSGAEHNQLPQRDRHTRRWAQGPPRPNFARTATRARRTPPPGTRS